MFGRTMRVVFVASVSLLASLAPATAGQNAAGQNAAGQAPPAAGLEQVAGKYQGTVTAPDGQLAVTCELKVAGGAVSGTMTAGAYLVTITGGNLAADRLTLTGIVNEMPLTMTATKNGDTYEGSWEAGGATGTFSLARVKTDAEGPPPPAAVSAAPGAAANAPAAGAGDPITGDWDGLVDTPDQQRSITLKLKLEGDKVSGEIGSEMGTVALQQGTFANNTLNVAFPFQTGDLITMAATLQEGKLVGTLTIGGGQMQLAWVAVRRK